MKTNKYRGGQLFLMRRDIDHTRQTLIRHKEAHETWGSKIARIKGKLRLITIRELFC